MKGLSNLIRLHRWRLDEKRRDLAEMERLAEELRAQGRHMEEDLKAEQKAASASPEAAYAYGSYATAMIARRAKLAASLAEVKAKIAQAAADVTESFQDLKRLEIAQDHRQEAARRSANKAEQMMLDEMGLTAHRRGGK